MIPSAATDPSTTPLIRRCAALKLDNVMLNVKSAIAPKTANSEFENCKLCLSHSVSIIDDISRKKYIQTVAPAKETKANKPAPRALRVRTYVAVATAALSTSNPMHITPTTGFDTEMCRATMIPIRAASAAPVTGRHRKRARRAGSHRAPSARYCRGTVEARTTPAPRLRRSHCSTCACRSLTFPGRVVLASFS